jgi:hypothetical protein
MSEKAFLSFVFFFSDLIRLYQDLPDVTKKLFMYTCLQYLCYIHFISYINICICKGYFIFFFNESINVNLHYLKRYFCMISLTVDVVNDSPTEGTGCM